jgi:hypothetical protein
MQQRFWKMAAAGVVAVGAFVPASAALAVDYPDGGTTSTVTDDPGAVSSSGLSRTEVAGKTQVKGELPFTGGDVGALAAIGGGTLAVGGLLVIQARKRRSVEPA